MREKDLQKLYECEFPPMKRLITEKEIFQKRLENKPIFVVTVNATKEQKDDMVETFWRTGVYRPMGYHEIDEFGFNAIVTYHINKRWSAKVYGGLNWNPDLRSPLTTTNKHAKGICFVFILMNGNVATTIGLRR